MSSRLQTLIDLGFEYAGEWSLNGEKLIYNLSKHQEANPALYAFVCDDDVMYIGKTTQPLKKRMNGYKNPGPSQWTNIANNAHMKELLDAQKQVQIFAFVIREPYEFRGIPVNLAAGLEDELIKRLVPPWNRSTDQE